MTSCLQDIDTGMYSTHNERKSIFEFGDHVRISKHKYIFAKGCAPNWSEEVLIIKKFNLNTVP